MHQIQAIARAAGFVLAVSAGAATAQTTVYDGFANQGLNPPAYTLADYAAKWANPYGLGEMALGDTRDVSGGAFAIKAAVFQTGFDFSVYDHLKYIATSTQSFAVPTNGSLTFSSVITATAHNTQAAGRVINGTYIQSGLPYSAVALEGQQAGAVMNMVDFATGQLFDWFVSGSTAFTLIERLPSAVTNPAMLPSDPNYVGIDKMYTQIINQISIGPGPHQVSITYNDSGSVSYYMDGVLVSHVDNVGIPLDQQGVASAGIYPSYGPGEALGGKIRSMTIGHGLFSLLDAFPFQHPDRPDLAVSIPLSERLFGQGMDATFDEFTVIAVPEPEGWALMLAGLGVVAAVARRRAATMAPPCRPCT